MCYFDKHETSIFPKKVPPTDLANFISPYVLYFDRSPYDFKD